MNKSNIRELKIKILEKSKHLKVNTEYCYDSFHFLRKNNNKINYLLSIGAVLTGSRALNSYHYMNKRIFNRKAQDWDLVVTRNMLLKFCAKYDIAYEFKNYLTIKGDLFSFNTGYGDTYRIWKSDIDIIVVDTLPSYKIFDGIRIANLGYIIDQKAKLIEENNYLKDKHLADIGCLLVKLNS